MKRIAFLLFALLSTGAFAQTPDSRPGCTYNATPPTLTTAQQTTLQCDNHGSLNISGSISAETSAVATAAAPSYAEGSTEPLSMVLAGGLRITGTISATSAATATAAAPTYVEGTSNPLSQNLSGQLRVLAAQTGGWTVAATQSGTWNITNISGTISLPTGASTAAKQPALGTAGSASADVITVQGITSMTPLKVDGTGGTFPVSGTVDPTTAASWGIGATGSAVPANSVLVGISDSVNSRAILQAANGTNSVGTGIPGIATIGQFDDVSPGAMTENRFGNLRISSNRNLYNTIRDAAGNERGANVTSGNALVVDGSASTQPISGTVTANQGTSPWIAAGGGTAGSAATGVVTVQGIASMTPVQVSQATASNLNATVVQGTATNLKAEVIGAGSAGTANAGVVTIQGIAGMTKVLVTPDANSAVNVAQINGVTPLMGNGTTGTGSQRVTIASDTTSNTNPFLVNGNVTPADGATLGTTSIRTYSAGGVYNGTTIDLARGAANSTNSTGTGITAAAQVGQCDDTSPTAITENSFGNQRIDCATHAHVTTPVPSATAGGLTKFTLTPANSTNATNVKSTPGQLYSFSGFNGSSATPAYISFYDTSGTPTCGTAIVWQEMIPGNTTGTGAIHDFAMPLAFTSGIGICVTTGIAGTGSVAATTYVVNLGYK